MNHPIPLLILLLISAVAIDSSAAGILDKRKVLERQTFWDIRDWDWYEANIPFLETPDPDIDTTYYYRWELVTKHLVYGSPESGYAFTEFIDRPFWSGRYGAISCPAGHQLYEVRWLADRNYAQDYAKYWFRTEGAQPRRYSTWLADSVWAVATAQGDRAFATSLLDDLVKNYQAWEKSHFSKDVGLFWQNGHDEGMEYSITSRQTQDIVRGGPGYRPSMNAYMYADALAISKIAKLANKPELEQEYAAKAASLKANVQKLLWDPKREFFFHVFKQDERDKEGNVVKAMTKVHETGKFAGSPHGREQIGYVPWQFNLPDKGFEAAWKFLMDENYFAAKFGPTTTERRDPMFLVTKTCCWWSGQSWPYATTQTLVAFANLLNNYDQKVVTKADYFKLLKTYTVTHRKDGKPYIAEGANPDTGSWEGYDSYNHSEHYFHSGYNDLIITGLCGLRVRDDDTIEANPLVPDDWPYFCLEDVRYRGRHISIVWDKTGERYGRGVGLRLFADGKQVAASPTLKKLSAPLPPPLEVEKRQPRPLNYAVNNDGYAFPRPIASHTSETSDLSKLIDGQYWYHLAPPNRWTAEGSTTETDWVGVDFGIARPIHAVKLYFLDEGKTVVPPAKVGLEYWDEAESGGKGGWKPVPDQKPALEKPHGRRANAITFPEIKTSKLRAVLTHAPNAKSGLSEFEAWGHGTLPVAPAPPPKGNLALSAPGRPFPRVTASFTSRFDKPEEATDGKVMYAPNPRNRWTAYESKNPTDWLEVAFGEGADAAKTVARATLHLYDDRGGVRAPESYAIEYFDGQSFKPVDNPKYTPKKPAGGKPNEATFTPVKTTKLRVVFTHRANAKSGLTELELWPE